MSNYLLFTDLYIQVNFVSLMAGSSRVKDEDGSRTRTCGGRNEVEEDVLLVLEAAVRRLFQLVLSLLVKVNRGR